MRTKVLIDNCTWDRLWERAVSLKDEAGDDLEFAISEYGEMEIPSADHPSEKARAVSEYVSRQRSEIDVAKWFSFGSLDSDASSKSVGSGFGTLLPNGSVSGGGYVSSVEGRAFTEANKHRIGGVTGSKLQKSGLLKNQTDIDYGEWAHGLYVVTLNIKDFSQVGSGKVINLEEWKEGLFGDFVREKIRVSSR